MPSDVDKSLSIFDRFAGAVGRWVAQAWFFVLCVLLVVVWAPSIFLIGDADMWHLLINTATSIITFLLVALVQNTQSRSDDAIQQKLNAVAEALRDLDRSVSGARSASDSVEELDAAVGLEDREGT